MKRFGIFGNLHNMYIKILYIREVSTVNKKEDLKVKLNKNHQVFLDSMMGQEALTNNNPTRSRREIASDFRNNPKTLSEIIRESR